METIVPFENPKVLIECGGWKFSADYYRFKGLCPLWKNKIIVSNDLRIFKLDDNFDLSSVQKFFQFVNGDDGNIIIPKNHSDDLLKLAEESGFDELRQTLKKNQENETDPTILFGQKFGTEEQRKKFLSSNIEEEDLSWKEKLIATNINRALQMQNFICNMSIDQIDRIISHSVNNMRNQDIEEKDKLNIHSLVDFVILMNERKKTIDYSTLLRHFSISEISLEDMERLFQSGDFEIDFIRHDECIIDRIRSLEKQVIEMKEIIEKQKEEIGKIKEDFNSEKDNNANMIKQYIKKEDKISESIKIEQQNGIDTINIIKFITNSILDTTNSLNLYENEYETSGIFFYYKKLFGEKEFYKHVEVKGTDNENKLTVKPQLMAICGSKSSSEDWRSGNFVDSCIFVDFKEFQFRFKQLFLKNPPNGSDFVKRGIVEGTNTLDGEWESITELDFSDTLTKICSESNAYIIKSPNEYYRYLRFRLEGVNQNNNNIINLSGFEILGYLKKIK